MCYPTIYTYVLPPLYTLMCYLHYIHLCVTSTLYTYVLPHYIHVCATSIIYTYVLPHYIHLCVTPLYTLMCYLHYIHLCVTPLYTLMCYPTIYMYVLPPLYTLMCYSSPIYTYVLPHWSRFEMWLDVGLGLYTETYWKIQYIILL